MIANIMILALVFSMSRRFGFYLVAGIASVTKGLWAYAIAASWTVALINTMIWIPQTLLVAFCMRRIMQKDVSKVEYKTPGTKSSNRQFIWEYIPLTAAIITLVFGEMILRMFNIVIVVA